MLYLLVFIGSALAIFVMFYTLAFVLKKLHLIKPVETGPLSKADVKYRGAAVLLALPLAFIIIFSFWAVPWMGWFWLIITVIIMAVMFTRTNQTKNKLPQIDSSQGSTVNPTDTSDPQSGSKPTS